MRLMDRLKRLEARRPLAGRRVAIIFEHDAEPAGADFVIRIVPAPFPEPAHAHC